MRFDRDRILTAALLLALAAAVGWVYWELLVIAEAATWLDAGATIDLTGPIRAAAAPGRFRSA